MWSINAWYKETFQYCFGVSAGWKTIDSFFTKPVSTEKKDSSDKIASTEEPISKESLPEKLMTVNMQAQFRP
jgi:hypothetical protein